MKPGPKELRQRELAAMRRYQRSPHALTRTVTPVLYGDAPVTKTPLPKPAARAKVGKVNRGGRPKKANALTPAQKQAAYRARMKAKA